MEIKILHVPRTGGTTLKSSLIDGYRVHRGIYLKTKIDGVYFCDHKAQISNDCQYVLFIRDPIDRLVSHLIYYRNRRSGYDTDNYFKATEPEFLKQFTDIDDFAKRGELYGELKLGFNYALRGIKGLKKYKDNLFFIGRTEYLEEDFKRLQTKLGTNYPISKTYNNRMPERLRKPLKPETKARLRKLLDPEYKIIKQLQIMGFIK